MPSPWKGKMRKMARSNAHAHAEEEDDQEKKLLNFNAARNTIADIDMLLTIDEMK